MDAEKFVKPCDPAAKALQWVANMLGGVEQEKGFQRTAAIYCQSGSEMIESLQSKLAAYQKYGEPCDWRNAQADGKEIARLKAENLDIAKQLAELQRYNVDCTKQFGMLQMDKVNLQNLLTESQRRERAADALLSKIKVDWMNPEKWVGAISKWRDPQEAGEGGQDE